MKKPCLITILLFITLTAFSQNNLINRTVASGGGYGGGPSSRLSWTIGDLVVDRFATANAVVTAGFQQAFQLALDIDLLDGELEIDAYPNPVFESLNIRFGAIHSDAVHIDIISTTGNLLKSIKVEGPFDGRIEQLNISELRSGIYLVRIYAEKGSLNKTFRIIKN